MGVRLFALAILGLTMAIADMTLATVTMPVAYAGVCLFFGAVILLLVYGVIFGEAP